MSSKTKKEGNVTIDVEEAAADIRKFYQNRFARVIPMYYACTVLAIPPYFANFNGLDPFSWGAFISSLLFTIIPVATLINPLMILGAPFFPINGPSWTICTLAIHWLVFPLCLIRIQKYTDRQLVRRIIGMFFLQVCICMYGYCRFCLYLYIHCVQHETHGLISTNVPLITVYID